MALPEATMLLCFGCKVVKPTAEFRKADLIALVAATNTTTKVDPAENVKDAAVLDDLDGGVDDKSKEGGGTVQSPLGSDLDQDAARSGTSGRGREAAGGQGDPERYQRGNGISGEPQGGIKSGGDPGGSGGPSPIPDGPKLLVPAPSELLGPRGGGLCCRQCSRLSRAEAQGVPKVGPHLWRDPST